MRRRSSIASKSPINGPPNRVRNAVRVGAVGAGAGWRVWENARGVAKAVRAVIAIRWRRDIVIVSYSSARSPEADDAKNAVAPSHHKASGDRIRFLTE